MCEGAGGLCGGFLGVMVPMPRAAWSLCHMPGWGSAQGEANSASVFSHFLCVFLSYFLRKVWGQRAMERLGRCHSSGAVGASPCGTTELYAWGHQPLLWAESLLPPIRVSPQKHGLTLQEPRLLGNDQESA